EAVVTAARVAESVAGSLPGRHRYLTCSFVPPRPDPSLVRPVASAALGIIRDGETLRDSAARLLQLSANFGAASDPALVALMIAISALGREESRGSHFRSDFPQ